MNTFLQTLRNLGPLRLAAIVIVTASLLGFFGFIMTRINTAPLALLYSNLGAQDAGAIAQKLDAMKIPYQVDPTGTLIRVPSDEVGKVRMMLSADDLPKGGSVGYEIFDQKEGFGTTSFVQNINALRALEGELARTISALDPVRSARVQLVLPQRELFSHDTQPATASVFLDLRGGAALTHEQIAAIQHLIAAAVPQLQPQEVSIVDQHGDLLAQPTDDSTAGAAASQDAIRAQFEHQQARKIQDLLAQTLGFGKVRAQVSADLDFDRITTSSVIFDPDSQVARSTQTTDDSSTSSEATNNAVTVTNNLPQTPGAPAPGQAAPTPVNKTAHSEETTNYEIDKTIRNQVHESGQVRRLSVAVVVDGTYTTDKNGKQTYHPRSAAEMANIKQLVESAINFDPARGDTVDVANMPFVQPEVPAAAVGSQNGLIAGVPKTELFHMIETLILAVIGLLVVLLLVRPILKKILDSTAMIAGGDQGLLAAGAYGGTTAQLPPPAGGLNRDIEAEAAQKENEIDRMIDISRVEGRVKASSLRKVGEIVDKHPDEAVSILRNWMYQESR